MEDVDAYSLSSAPQHGSHEVASTAPSRSTLISVGRPSASQEHSSVAIARKPSPVITRSSTVTASSGSAVWCGPLHIAAHKGNGRIIRAILQYNGDCNEKDGDGMTPLMHAAAGGHKAVVMSLLAHGPVLVSLTLGAVRPCTGQLLTPMLMLPLTRQCFVFCSSDFVAQM